MSETRNVEVGYLDASEAARYLGLARSTFLAHVRPHVPFYDLRAPGSQKPMPRWIRSDLDRWAALRRRERVA